jgi:hypothetical protein
MPNGECWFSLVVFGLQLFGLASVVLARLRMESLCHHLRQRMFFGCWMLMGAATLCALAIGSGCWMSCGTTFSVMAVGAIVDNTGNATLSTF